MRNGKMGAHGCHWRMERCSVLTAKCLTKQAETNSSQVVNRCAWRMSAHMKQAMLIKLATRRSETVKNVQQSSPSSKRWLTWRTTTLTSWKNCSQLRFLWPKAKSHTQTLYTVLAQGIKKERQLRIKKYFEFGKNIISFDLLNCLCWTWLQPYK